jgi:hypothetical protein
VPEAAAPSIAAALIAANRPTSLEPCASRSFASRKIEGSSAGRAVADAGGDKEDEEYREEAGKALDRRNT